MLILVQFSVKMYRMLLLEGKIRGHPSQFWLEPGIHPNCKRQRSAYSFICFQEVQETWSFFHFLIQGSKKVTISVAHNESKGLYLGRLPLMSLMEGWFGNILKSPLVYPFYWHKKHDSESSLFFENELTHLPEYDTFHFWVPAGIHRPETIG